jgi:hypothetical protein
MRWQLPPVHHPPAESRAVGSRVAPLRGEAGQAAPEWVGLVLLVTIALGALAAFRAPARGDPGVGETVASRITCAAGGSCAGAPEHVPARGRAGPASLQAPVRDSPPARAGPPTRPTRARAIDALRRLRGVGVTLAKRAWIVCLGYRRFRYELEHPRAPNQVMPVEEALDIANGCLNPYGFLVEE